MPQPEGLKPEKRVVKFRYSGTVLLVAIAPCPSLPQLPLPQAAVATALATAAASAAAALTATVIGKGLPMTCQGSRPRKFRVQRLQAAAAAAAAVRRYNWARSARTDARIPGAACRHT